MKKSVVVLVRIFHFVLLMLFGPFIQAQCETLQFIELGYEPAFCRTASYQTGNAVAYGAATGGTPDYSYTWVNLQTGQVVINTTFGGLNPGDYYFKVVDDIGCVIDTVIKIDSVIPIADFNILAATQTSYDGVPVVEVEIHPASRNWEHEYGIWWDLEPDTLNRVSIDGAAWEIISSQASSLYTFNDLGYHEICLTTSNHNGCSDTICKNITIGDFIDGSPALNITSSSVTGEIFINLLINYDVHLNIYDFSGAPVTSQVVVPGPNLFTFTTGQYIYDVVDPVTGQILTSGTFFVL